MTKPRMTDRRIERERHERHSLTFRQIGGVCPDLCYPVTVALREKRVRDLSKIGDRLKF